MPPEARRLEVRAWLDRAAEDLRAAEVDLAAKPPLVGDAAFHCQQAVEKSMKGLFVADGEAFGKTHDLRALGDRLATRHPELASRVDDVAEFTEYAWRFRYPGDFHSPPDEVHDALTRAQAFVDVVASLAERRLQ